MKRIYLVTGAYGHLGNTVVNELLSRGYSVRAFALPEDEGKKPFIIDVPTVYGNICDEKALEEFFDPCYKGERIVIHAAGIVSIASHFNQAVYDVNVTGTKKVIEACQKFGAYKLIYVSSVHAIPPKKNEVTREIKDFDPQKVSGLYAKTKAEATAAVLQATAEGLNACIVHPSGIIGPNDYGKGHLTQLVIDYVKGRLTACVKGGYDFTDVRDVANGIIACIDRGEKGETYILSNRYISVKEILDELHEATGKKKIKTVLPMWFAKLTAPLAEAYYKLLKQPPLFTAYSLETLDENTHFSHEKASVKLGYKTRPLADTIHDTFVWLKSNGRV